MKIRHARRQSLFRALAVTTCLFVASGCANPDVGSSASPAGSRAPSVPAEPAQTGPQVGDHIRVSASIGRTEEFPDTLGLGSDFNDIFIFFNVSYFNVGTVDVVGVEGHLRLINAFGDETARVGFTKTETLRSRASLVDSDSGLNFKRYECDMRQGEWCRALDSGFANYRLEAVVDRVALPGGRVIQR